MRLACPSCQASYDVPDDRLGTGARRLRCACCAHEWTVEPPMPEAVPEVAPLPPPALHIPVAPLVAAPRTARVPSFPPYRAPPSRRRGALLAWAASVLLLVGLAIAAVRFQAQITQAWPPSQRVYAAFAAVVH